MRVHMDAIGPTFTLSLQGSPVDYWTDSRLELGRGRVSMTSGDYGRVIQSLRFTFIKKGGQPGLRWRLFHERPLTFSASLPPRTIRCKPR